MNDEFNWEAFEQITKAVIEIICGDRVKFICSGRKCILKNDFGDNQFDVLFKWNSDLKTSYIAVECKYYNSLIDKEHVREFLVKCDDCKIDTRIMVSKLGFTDRAISEAKAKNIELIHLKDFSQEDFDHTFKGKVMSFDIEMLLMRPDYNCSVGFSPKSKDDKIPPMDMHDVIKLVFDDGMENNLIDHIPLGRPLDGNSLQTVYGFNKVGERKEGSKDIVEYKKTINCRAIKHQEKLIEVGGVVINMQEVNDPEKIMKNRIKINFREEIMKAGYLVAKKLCEVSNFVLDLKSKTVVDKTNPDSPLSN